MIQRLAFNPTSLAFDATSPDKPFAGVDGVKKPAIESAAGVSPIEHEKISFSSDLFGHRARRICEQRERVGRGLSLSGRLSPPSRLSAYLSARCPIPLRLLVQLLRGSQFSGGKPGSKPPG